MKKVFLVFAWVVCFLVGCDQTQEVTIDSPTLEVSPQVVRPGEAVTLTLLPGENTNVDLSLSVGLCGSRELRTWFLYTFCGCIFLGIFRDGFIQWKYFRVYICDRRRINKILNLG